MSTGRYQSRVFNFLSQQSLRLRDRSAQTWRQVKVAAVWGVQILLYPVYLGFQSTRLVEKQLQQTTRQAIPRLLSAGRALRIRKPLSSAMPTADAPLQTVLQSASKTALTDPTLQIRGIASRLDTGSLVLVTAQNQTLDLSFEQQTELTRRIAWETANYWRQRRLFEPMQQPPIVSTFLPPVKPQRNALLPVRVLQTVMAWMQRGSVAVSANLFQESRLVVYLPSQPALSASTDELSLRSAQPSWIAMEAQFYDWLEQAGHATTDLLLAGLKTGQITFSEIVARFIERRSESQSLPSMPQPIKPLHLPAAGDWLPVLDRWLSKVPGLEQPQLPAPSEPQPWLTMEDLFDRPIPVLTANLEVAQNPDLIPPQPPRIPFKAWIKRSLGSILPERQTATDNPAVWETTDTAALETAIKTRLIKFSQPKWMRPQANSASQSLTRSQSAAISPACPPAMVEFHADQRLKTPRRINPLDQVAPLSSLDTANQEEAAMLPQSWIETEAKLVEYVKHPLEHLLEWLDKSMLWIETRVAKIWRWLTHPIE